MRTCIAGLLLAFFLSACSGESNLDKINGQWLLEVKATSDINEDLREAYQETPEMVESILGKVSASFDATGKKVTLSMGAFSETRDFTVAEDSGKKLVLDSGSGKTEITVESAERFILVDSKEPQKKLVFVRTK